MSRLFIVECLKLLTWAHTVRATAPVYSMLRYAVYWPAWALITPEQRGFTVHGRGEVNSKHLRPQPAEMMRMGESSYIHLMNRQVSV